ncbi:MAG: hypothetical protein DRP45_01225 [Candidatus Zixiibacteriota bacterium]|nr:MAG: hypothetical protein DRP45_01225 [candidate division Zixibacteria bacterium]
MKAKTLLYNGRIHTQAGGLVVDSMAIDRNCIVAVGNRLEHDPDFRSYHRIDLRSRTIVPGFTDAHTHFYHFARTFGQVSLDGVDSLEKCLTKIAKFARSLPKRSWVVGLGYSPDRFKKRIEPDRHMLDRITDGRPAFIYSKDQHTAWVNSRALEIAGISATTPDPAGGEIVRFADGEPSGILREISAYDSIYKRIPSPSKKELDRSYQKALEHAHRKGVTGLHSFDGAEAFNYLSNLAERNRCDLRINYYPPARSLSLLESTGTVYGAGTEFFRIAGVKLFADGALGSQTAFCLNKYVGSRDNRGIEVMNVSQIKQIVRRAAKLGLSCAIHAIGDRAVANVLDAITGTRPPRSGARHRIEHMQLIRRKDLLRVKKLGIVASMQPSHCPSDMEMVYKYWGKRSRNAYVFRSVLDRKIDLAFGSDVPIEPLDPLAGIAAAVRRAKQGSSSVFHPEQRISAVEALYGFTAGPAVACGQSHCRGYLLPSYPADFVVLSQDITRIAPKRISDTRVLATILDGTIKYSARSLNW